MSAVQVKEDLARVVSLLLSCYMFLLYYEYVCIHIYIYIYIYITISILYCYSNSSQAACKQAGATRSEAGRRCGRLGRDQRDFRQRACTENRGAIRFVMV